MQTLTRGVLQKCLLYFLGSTHQSVTVWTVWSNSCSFFAQWLQCIDHIMIKIKSSQILETMSSMWCGVCAQYPASPIWRSTYSNIHILTLTCMFLIFDDGRKLKRWGSKGLLEKKSNSSSSTWGAEPRMKSYSRLLQQLYMHCPSALTVVQLLFIVTSFDIYTFLQS